MTPSDPCDTVFFRKGFKVCLENFFGNVSNKLWLEGGLIPNSKKNHIYGFQVRSNAYAYIGV